MKIFDEANFIRKSLIRIICFQHKLLIIVIRKFYLNLESGIQSDQSPAGNVAIFNNFIQQMRTMT